MPLVEIHMLEGRSAEQKQRLLETVTDAVRNSTGASLESIRVWIHEFSRGEYMAAGRMKPPPEPSGDGPAGG